MVCSADHTEYCGNQDRIAVYRASGTGGPQGPQTCISTNVANFTLVAAFKNPPTSGPATLPLKMVLVELVPNIVWSILSVSVAIAYSQRFPVLILPKHRHAQTAVLSGQISLSKTPSSSREHLLTLIYTPRRPLQQMVNHSGSSLSTPLSPDSRRTVPWSVFVSLFTLKPLSQRLVPQEDTASAVGSPPLLSFGGKADAFSLCSNNTANGRLDVVYSPVTGHPHYSLSDCNPITIQVIGA